MKKSTAIGVSLASAVLSVWLAWANIGPLLTWLGYSWEFDKLGQWADSFGALNTLFGAFGFSAVIWTLWVQREQIKSSEADQHRQRFDSTYFEMLKLLRETRKDVRFRHSREFQTETGLAKRESLTGLRAFREAWQEAIYFIEKPGFVLNAENVSDAYTKYIHAPYESNFGPYFRLLYTILSRIDGDKFLTEEEKHKYGNLLRSQLNSYELAVTGLNGLSPVAKDFSKLIVQFHLLKYLPEGTRRKTLLECYPEQAFASRD